jgi:hypothetical protein
MGPRRPGFVVLWHHQVLCESAYGICHALDLMSIENECVHSRDRVIRDTGDVFVIVGVHHFQIQNLPVNYIVAQTEQPGSNWFNPSLYEALDGAMGIIDFSPRLNDEWRSLGYRSFYVPIRLPMDMFIDTGAEDIFFDVNVNKPRPKDIDVLFYGGRRDRRLRLEKRLKKKFPKKKIVFRYYDLFGEEREDFISRAKIVLNTHFWPESSLETHRIEYLMARGKCVVSENSMDADLDAEYAGAVHFCGYDNMELTISRLLRNPAQIESSGRRARLLSENHQFDMRPLRNALEGCLESGVVVLDPAERSDDEGLEGTSVDEGFSEEWLVPDVLKGVVCAA